MNNTVIAVIAIAVIGFGAYLIMSTTSEPATDPDVAMAPIEDVPDSMETDTSMNEPETNEDEAMNIVEIASANEDFSTLVTAVAAADLVDTLQGAGPFTVFAPTNAAFTDLPEGTVASLLLPENQADLAGVLTYHVVPGAVMSADLSDGMEVTTVNGATITINVGADGVTVNEANVVTADMEASNGVIHVIDAVILPPTE